MARSKAQKKKQPHLTRYLAMLDSPNFPHWPVIPSDVLQEVAERFKRMCESEMLQRPGKGKKWECSKFRKHLVLGVNEVTKCMEREDVEFCLLLVSRDPGSLCLVKHLMYMCHTTNTPCIPIPNLSELARQCLAVKCALVMAFRKIAMEECTALGEFLDFCEQHSRQVKVMWEPKCREKSSDVARIHSRALPAAEAGPQPGQLNIKLVRKRSKQEKDECRQSKIEKMKKKRKKLFKL